MDTNEILENGKIHLNFFEIFENKNLKIQKPLKEKYLHVISRIKTHCQFYEIIKKFQKRFVDILETIDDDKEEIEFICNPSDLEFKILKTFSAFIDIKWKHFNPALIETLESFLNEYGKMFERFNAISLSRIDINVPYTVLDIRMKNRLKRKVIMRYIDTLKIETTPSYEPQHSHSTCEKVKLSNFFLNCIFSSNINSLVSISSPINIGAITFEQEVAILEVLCSRFGIIDLLRVYKILKLRNLALLLIEKHSKADVEWLFNEYKLNYEFILQEIWGYLQNRIDLLSILFSGRNENNVLVISPPVDLSNMHEIDLTYEKLMLVFEHEILKHLLKDLYHCKSCA